MRLPHALRTRLVLVLTGTALVGLVLMGFASVTLLGRSLHERVDERLIEMSRPWQSGRRPPPPPPNEQGPHGQVPTDFRVVFFDRSDQQTGMVGQSTGDDSGPLLRQPPPSGDIITVADRTGGPAWRARASVLPNGETIVLALSLSSVESTVSQLIIIELVVGAIVLLVLAVLTMLTVRFSLRPLTRIEHTADAIAAGELDRRVPDQDPSTETGRLGTALNTMLERLTVALRQRESSEQRLRRFLADASHELRTPLTSIRGFAELYQRSEGLSEEQARTMIGRISSEAERMSSLVEDLFLLARLDRERSVDLAELDLVSVLEETAQDARARAPEREITLSAPEPVRVLGDSARLRQVVTNLLGNALTHTTAGTPVELSVSSAHRGPASGTESEAAGIRAWAGAEFTKTKPVVTVGVHDRGPQVPHEHAGHIFDRFYQVTGGVAAGTGLGLAIAAAIAEAHDGRVELHANDHGGNTFVLVLPLE